MEATSLSSGQRALRDAETTVSKIGGENAADLSANADLVRTRAEKGGKQILVVSALRSSSGDFDRFAHPDAADRDSDGKIKSGFNTTSHLIALAEHLRAGDRTGALDLFERVRAATKEIVRTEIERNERSDSREMLSAVFASIDGFLDNVRARIFNTDKKPVAVGKDWLLHSEHGSVSITGIGEYLAKAIYHTYFHMKNISVGELNTEGLVQWMRGKDSSKLLEQRQAQELLASVRNSVRAHIGHLLDAHDVVVAGGYLPVLGSRRGYSDRTGALIAQEAREAGHTTAYLIEKKSPIMSADPRKIRNARLVEEMTYELAMEAFGDQRGADGGAVHPEALRMLAEQDIPALVFNPQDESSITHIHAYDPPPNGVEIVASRRMPIALEIQSIRMLGQPGFIHTISGWFAERGISIDQGGGTSEVTTTFTFTNGDVKNFDLEEFRRFLQETYGPDRELVLDVREGKSMVFCLGNNMTQPGALLNAATALHQVQANIHFISKGLNP
ncbi:MAG: hypothetical protein PHO54_05850, partial [Candidatus Peribacteraceae bacterium]|nr:hypothetical protein [Candidatus Peribacteraceae bacterium]